MNDVLGTGLVGKQCKVYKHGITSFLLPPYITAESRCGDARGG